MQRILVKNLLGAFATLIAGAFPVLATSSAVTQATRSADLYGNLPQSFEVNKGQVDKAVKFFSRGQGYTLFLTSNEAVLRLIGPEHEASVVRLQVVGGNRHPRMTGELPLPTKSNYFLGNDSRQWHVGVPSYARVRYEGIYRGVDLVYRGNQRQLEYDFEIAPHADPGRIRLAFRGATSITIGAKGELILHTPNGVLVQPPPTVYQEVKGIRERVEGHYVLLPAPMGKSIASAEGSPSEVGFMVGTYNRARPLVIDPVLEYSTFLGGSSNDRGQGIAVDSAGNAYVTGSTASITFPGVSGSSLQSANGGGRDAFVIKINSTGTAIVYSTFLGGHGNDSGNDIAVDSTGKVYITGETCSSTFPGVSGSSIQPVHGGSLCEFGGGGDAFITKVNTTGTAIIYSTFLGGSDGDSGEGIAVDGVGNAYVTGRTDSEIFPGVSSSSIQPAPGGAFVTKINAAGSAIVYSTFLGEGPDDGFGIAVDGAGNAYVTGRTSSETFTGVSASSIQPFHACCPFNYDAFVTKINATGTATVYSTFLGGSLSDGGLGIAVDGVGNAYVTGFTCSATFPGVTSNSIQPNNGSGGSGFCEGNGFDAFLTKINPTGTAIVYSTFLGGNGGDSCEDIAVDSVGNALVTGSTNSAIFPGVSGSSIQPVIGGDYDAFVTKVNSMGTAIVYSTFLGGSARDGGVDIALDGGGGNAYVTGFTASSTFPGVSLNSIQQSGGGGGGDAFVTKVSGISLIFADGFESGNLCGWSFVGVATAPVCSGGD